MKFQYALLALLVAPAVAADPCDVVNVWYSMVTTFSYVGAVLAIGGIVLGCLPTCCNKLKEKKKLTGWAAIIIGLVSLALPAIISSIMVESAVNSYCEDCAMVTCTDASRKESKDDLHALGMIVAYTLALGFVPAILGIISMAMGGATLCGCCGAKADAAPAAGAVVVATPASK